MIDNIRMEDIYPLMAQMLDQNGTVTFTVSGISMQPMLYDRRDTVTIVKPILPLKKYDLPFYRMDDGRFVLHRIIQLNPDGTYNCRGDNRWESEDNIREDQIIGVVKSFTRNGKKINVDKSLGYWLYTRTWCFFHHFKRFYNLPQRLLNRAKSLKLKVKDIYRNKGKVKILSKGGIIIKIEYRPATAGDMKHIYALCQKLNEYEIENFGVTTSQADWSGSDKGQVYFQKLRKEHFLWVAACNGVPVGYCSGRLSNLFWNNQTVGELINLFVDEEYRNLGIANKLITTFKDYCHTRDCKVMNVAVNEKNTVAYRLYQKHGFKDNTKTLLCEID